MQAQAIQTLLADNLADCDIRVQGDGSHFEIVIIGALFDGLRAIKRQQHIYAILNDAITSGAIHAVNMKLYTPQEWAHAHQQT